MDTPAKSSDVVLEVVSPGAAPEFVPVTQSPFLLGRGRESGNHLALEDRRISRSCAAIVAAGRLLPPGRPRAPAGDLRQRGAGGARHPERRRCHRVRPGRLLQDHLPFLAGAALRGKHADAAGEHVERDVDAGLERTEQVEPAAGGHRAAALVAAAGCGAAHHARSRHFDHARRSGSSAGAGRGGRTEGASGKGQRRQRSDSRRASIPARRRCARPFSSGRRSSPTI